jgi:hypothetical protein
MAGIDKIYLDWKDWLKFKKWLEENNHTSIKEIQFDWTYVINQDIPKDCVDYPVTNLPHRVDYWLMKHCPLWPIIERLCEQYGEDEVIKRQGKNQRKRFERKVRYNRYLYK